MVTNAPQRGHSHSHGVVTAAPQCRKSAERSQSKLWAFGLLQGATEVSEMENHTCGAVFLGKLVHLENFQLTWKRH